MKSILFLSTHNSCRSQIAQALVNHHFHGRIKAYSAGVEPREIHPYTLDVMHELGIDISDQENHRPEDFREIPFDYVITMCNETREQCPLFWTTGEAIYDHMQIDNPFEPDDGEENVIKRCREVRDLLEEKLMLYFDREMETELKSVS